MRVHFKNGSLTQPLLVGRAQEFVDTEDFMLAMKKFVKPCGNVENMFIDFENTQIPVSNVSEIRVIAQMAAAYQNACLAQNLSHQRDLYGNIYTANEANHVSNDSRQIDTMAGIPTEVNKAEFTTAKHKKNLSKRKKLKSPEQKTSSADTWDEEMYGEQIVYDVNYEQNEDLVPWLMDPVAWEEKYGFY